MRRVIANDEELQVVEVLGKPALFSDELIDRNTLPKGLVCYDLRHGDDNGFPCTIETSVVVNHYGSIVVKEPFKLLKDRYLPIEYDDFAFTEDNYSINEFLSAESD